MAVNGRLGATAGSDPGLSRGAVRGWCVAQSGLSRAGALAGAGGGSGYGGGKGSEAQEATAEAGRGK